MDNIYRTMLSKYADDPAGWVRDVVGIDPLPWQKTVLKEITRKSRLSIRSGHGVGKSACAAWGMLWFLFFHFPVKVVCTSPSQSQLMDSLMAELKANIRKLPQSLVDLLEVFSDRVTLIGAPTEAFISARTARADESGPQSLQGIHSENVLLVVDEASACSDSIFISAGSSMTAPTRAVMLLLGNPVRSQGYFYDTHHRMREDWFTMKVSCIDNPLVGKDYVPMMAKKYGEESSVYAVRCLGEFPTSDSDSLISLELVEGAQMRDVALHESEPIYWGVDVARFGDDASAVCIRQGNQVLEPVTVWRKLDLMETTGRIMEMYDSVKGSDAECDSILVDSIGLGSAVVDRLTELGAPVTGINVSESPSMGSNYLNLRAELWFKAREWLESKDVKIPREDDRLAGELVLPKYGHNSAGKLKVESKEAMKKRSGASPDCADAFCLTFATQAAWASGKFSKKKGGPLLRNIGGII